MATHPHNIDRKPIIVGVGLSQSEDHCLAAWIDEDGTFHAAPEFDPPPLISPAILASLDAEAHRASVDGGVREIGRIDRLPAYTHEAHGAHPVPPVRNDWLADLTDWMIANNDRVGRWIERAILGLIAAMVALMLWHLGPLALRAVL